jgi:hypothetical protein
LQPSLDRGKQVGLDDGECLPELAEVPRFAPLRSGDQDRGAQTGSTGERGSGRADHRIASPVPTIWRRQAKPIAA